MSVYPLPPATDCWTASYPASLASPSSSADLYEQHGAPPYTPPLLSDWALPRRMSSKGKEREHVDMKAFAVGNVDLSYHAADIVCHLLYSNELTPSTSTPSSSYLIYPTLAPSTLAQVPSVDFRNFVRTTITTTAVSQAVIIMSLWYIYKLRSKKCRSSWNPGSEFRMIAIGLVLANKYLDDSTYTSKTWSNVTHIPLHEMNTLEVAFLSGLKHEMGITEPDYCLWVHSINAFINATYHQSQTVSSYSIPSDYPFTFQSSYPTPPYQDVSFNTAPRARSTSPRRRIQRMTTQPVYHHRLAEGDTTSVASVPPPSVSGRKRSAGDVFSPDTTRIRKTRSSALAMAEYPQYTSSVPALPPISQMQIAPSQYSAAPSPLHNQTFAIGQGDQYPAPVYQQMPPVADSAYGITDAYLNTNMLQAPYNYQSGLQQPRPEDLTFFTLAASPIGDEFQRQQQAEWVAKLGKPRVPHHGLYQSSAATPYYNDVRSTAMPYRQYNQLPPRRTVQSEAVRRLSAPSVNYLGGDDGTGYDYSRAAPVSAGYAANPPLSGSVNQQTQGYPSVDPLLSYRY